MDSWSRALAMLLRASRYIGIAPYSSLHLAKTSRSFALYSRVIFFCYGGLTLPALWLEVYTRTSKDRKTSRTTKLWLFQSVAAMCFMSILYIGMFQSSHRMRRTFYYWKRVKMICRSVGQAPTMVPVQRHVGILFAMMQFTIIFLILFDIWALPRNFVNYKPMVYIYTVIYSGYIVTNIITLYFVLVALMINSCFQAINEQMEEIVSEMQADEERLRSIGIKIPLAKINHAIDTLGMFVEDADTDEKLLHEKLRSLARAYVTTCDLVRQHNSSEETLLLLLLIFVILNLVNSVWYIVSGLMINGRGSDFTSIALDTIWYLLHVFRGMMLVAPWHAMDEEVERTRNLVSNLMCQLRCPYDPMRAELDMFFIHLMTNQPCYMVLGTYTMKRSLVFTMMSFATTCLAIFSSFES